MSMADYDELSASDFEDEEEALMALEKELANQKNQKEDKDLTVIDKINQRGEAAMAEEAIELARQLKNG